ncbi:MAG: LuxR C-terminal-related transcriptional regulator [Candidatus Methylomirabilales bacterium]
MAAIRVLATGSSGIVLQGVQAALAHERDMVTTAAFRAESSASARRWRPDVVILAQDVDGPPGVLAVRRLMDEKLATRVILLTRAVAVDEVLEVLRLGVAGIVLGEMPPHLLAECVRAVHRGEQWVERRLLAAAVETLLRREAGAREVSRVLTPREIAILRGVAGGLSNREMAETLYISEGTVKTHLHSIYQKLQVAGRRALAQYALDRGLLGASPPPKAPAPPLAASAAADEAPRLSDRYPRAGLG